ncbi:MAG: hypothetical protein HY695_37520 [Deltaproteobacteria bacterium]|nr:hypothetical protein [Deltaproteobacteria bacterium]
MKTNPLGPKEDFFVLATLRVRTYAVTDIPCKIYLPARPISKPRFDFKPTQEQWQQVSVFWQVTFEAKLLDRFGRTTDWIYAPEVYLENKSTTQWGPNLYDCVFSGQPQNLRVVHYLNQDPHQDKSENTRFVLWLSPNSMLQPAMIATSSYAGNVEMEKLDQLRVELTPDIHLEFDREFRHENIPNQGTLHWSFLVANTTSPCAADDVDKFNSSVLPTVDDFLWIAGLGSRTRTACVGWAASDGRTYTRYYRGNLVFPTGSQEPTLGPGLVSLGDYEEFLSTCWSAFRVHPGKEAIRGAIQALVPDRHQTLEESFLALFAGLEELVLDYRVRNDLESIITNSNEWRKIRNAIKNAIKKSIDPAIDRHQRALLYTKLNEINRVPLQYAFRRFCSDCGIDVSDVWPIFATSEGVGLADVRNKLIHGNRFPDGLINALSIARDNLKWVLERAVVRVLGWLVERTELAPMFLSANDTSLTGMPEARRQLSEYLASRS